MNRFDFPPVESRTLEQVHTGTALFCSVGEISQLHGHMQMTAYAEKGIVDGKVASDAFRADQSCAGGGSGQCVQIEQHTADRIVRCVRILVPNGQLERLVLQLQIVDNFEAEQLAPQRIQTAQQQTRRVSLSQLQAVATLMTANSRFLCNRCRCLFEVTCADRSARRMKNVSVEQLRLASATQALLSPTDRA